MIFSDRELQKTCEYKLARDDKYACEKNCFWNCLVMNKKSIRKPAGYWKFCNFTSNNCSDTIFVLPNEVSFQTYHKPE